MIWSAKANPTIESQHKDDINIEITVTNTRKEAEALEKRLIKRDCPKRDMSYFTKHTKLT